MEPDYLKHAETLGSEEMIEIMSTYGNDVLRYAYAITGQEELAKDIAQEVFVKAHLHIRTFRGQSSFKTWLLAITRNQALNELRSGYFRKVLLFGSVRSKEEARSAEADWISEQSVTYIWDTIMGLSRKLREVLVLDLEHDLTIREMAQLLQISEGTVKSRLFRARREVERKLRCWEHEEFEA
ncbi:RNA polymerase sigma factor [Xylanibacillus composti]|uniref:RNA polymerase sigma factor n=1 Tax=Xylanibacillus composti TaxID=1572762 RepID=A0A8J4M2G5_9BACL|nr:sigma-70 family RNA polymerase sigma factor [Xylanibacillus composti]MDT9724807.1 RNA polymerase sigma factor [Xylanibacillus composti]GIQ69840.1 RNA polymerase sigma factor [Xylanibacillus composti]